MRDAKTTSTPRKNWKNKGGHVMHEHARVYTMF